MNDVHLLLLSFPTRRSSDLVPRSTTWFTGKIAGSPSIATARRPTGADRNSSSDWWTARCSVWCWSCCGRSEEHTSELQSRGHLVCRLLLEKKNRRHRSGFTKSRKIL